MKFHENLCAYYEVFHERLSLTNREDVSRFSSTSWPSGHSGTMRYFDEFIPILRPNGGVLQYDKRMSYDWMIPSSSIEGGLRPQEKAYLDLLVETAWEKHKTPVLTFNRGTLRAEKMRLYLDAYVVLLIRNPLFQWISHLRQRQLGVDYFLRAAARVGQQLLSDQYFARSLKCYLPPRMNKQNANVTDLSLDEAWVAFAGIQIITNTFLFPNADIVISIDDLSKDSKYHSEISSILSELTRQNFKLDPATVPREIPPQMRDRILSQESVLRNSTLQFTARSGIDHQQMEFALKQVNEISRCASSVTPSYSGLDLLSLADKGHQAMAMRKAAREGIELQFESALDLLEDEFFPQSFSFWTK